MIIIELIDNYRNAQDFYEEIYEDKLKIMYEENKIIRDNFIDSYNIYNLKCFTSKEFSSFLSDTKKSFPRYKPKEGP